MTVLEVGIIVSLGAFVVSFIGLILSGRKDTRQDAAANAVIQTKLDGISSGVDDIRIEMRTMRESINDHGERLARVEARSQSNSHRLDTLEGKTKG